MQREIAAIQVIFAVRHIYSHVFVAIQHSTYIIESSYMLALPRLSPQHDDYKCAQTHKRTTAGFTYNSECNVRTRWLDETRIIIRTGPRDSSRIVLSCDRRVDCSVLNSSRGSGVGVRASVAYIRFNERVSRMSVAILHTTEWCRICRRCAAVPPMLLERDMYPVHK